MPSFSKETMDRWHRERIEKALSTRKPDEHQLEQLREELQVVENDIAHAIESLSYMRAYRNRLQRKPGVK